MKKNNLILVSFFLIVVVIAGYYLYTRQQDANQLPQNSKNECENVDIQDVALQSQAIENNIANYALSTKNIVGQSTEGGQQTNYSLDGKWVLIKQTFYGETGKSEVSYYLQSGKVFYFSKKNTEYVLPISEDPSGKVKNVETKDFYLDGNQILCSWYSDKKLQPNDQDTKDLVNYLISGL